MRRLLGIVLAVLFSLIILTPMAVNATSQSLYSPYSAASGYLDARDGSGNLTHVIGGPLSGNSKGGVNGDIMLATTTGDYCNYYTNSSSDYITGTVSSPQNNTTGFSPLTPLSGYQEGDSNAHNVCQTSGGSWGFKVSGVSSSCSTAVCGMHHFVRLGGDTRPWSTTTIPSTALSFSVDNVNAQTASLNSGGGAVGYFCPILQDTTTTRYLEYCFIEWRTGQNVPANTYACANTEPTGNNIDTVWSNIDANQSWITERPDAHGTTQTVPSNYKQTASISGKNLQNAVSFINSTSGCDRTHTAWGPDSSSVGDYKVIGFEDGLEGSNFTTLGGSVSNEKLMITNDTLFPGDDLVTNGTVGTLYDSNGNYQLVMQGDGNLVESLIANLSSHPWYSNTGGTPGAYAEMQTDGNFVVYNPSRTVALGNTRTSGNSGAYAILQPDGNFVVYLGNQYKWASSQHTPYGF